MPQQVLAINDDFPIKTSKKVHQGKVRSVYWLSKQDSQRLIENRNYQVPIDTPLAIMIISDRISAFDCIWQGEDNLHGIPGKGAALNAIATHWFNLFKTNHLASSHILETPHPLVWIVQKAKPIKLEAICRQYITGSMWRSYEEGEREFCGIKLPDNLTKNAKLSSPLLTPSTKGILRGLQNIPEFDDVNISRKDIEANYAAFGFHKIEDINQYEHLLQQGFQLIQKELASKGQLFVDTKFEFGYIKDNLGQDKLIYIDEVGTPDSSRIWDEKAYRNNVIIEKSKESFRQFLLNFVDDPKLLLDKTRMIERTAFANRIRLPTDIMLKCSQNYIDIAQTITGKKLVIPKRPREEILDLLDTKFKLI